jgi:hypothetical protein
VTRGYLCEVLFGGRPVTARSVANSLRVAYDEVDAFYRALRAEGLVNFDEGTGVWTPIVTSKGALLEAVKELGIDRRQLLGFVVDGLRG